MAWLRTSDGAWCPVDEVMLHRRGGDRRGEARVEVSQALRRLEGELLAATAGVGQCSPSLRRTQSGEFVFGDPATWGAEQAVTVTDTRLYGKATAQAWDRLHPRLTRRAAWLDHDGPLPLIEGTVIRLAMERLPSGGVNKLVWLWWSGTGASAADVDRCWQSFLHRFDIEHTFRLFKQTLGWTKPRIRSSEAADRWTWLVIAAYAQLRLARPLATDLRRPWKKPAEPNRLTPARVRRGFRNLRTKTGSPTGAPKPSRPGPGRSTSRLEEPSHGHSTRGGTRPRHQ